MYMLPPLTAEDILLYLRKSQSDDPLLTVEEVLAKHEQMLDDWVERNLPDAGRVPEKNRLREVKSGETIASRPAVQEVLRRIESPKVKALLIVEPQRLTRGYLDEIGKLVKMFKLTNTIVITLQFTYDLRDDRDREAFERELMRGNEFLEYQKRIMNNGRIQSVKNGNYLGTVPPYGYRKISYKEGKKKCYTLEPIPEEVRVVNMIFTWYAEGLGSHTIAKKLNKMGIPGPRGGKWAPESMAKIRSNEHYIGNVIWNHRQTVQTVEDGEIITSRPKQKDFLRFPGKQPAIIDRELWDKVQEIRDKIPPVKDKAKCVNPFAGLVVCQCGKAMTKRVYKNKDGTERSPTRLLCTSQHDCKTASCLESEMQAAVVKILQEKIDDFEMHIKKGDDELVELHQQTIKQHELRLQELKEQEDALWEKRTFEGMPVEVFNRLEAKRLEEKETIMQALCIMKESMPEPIDYTEKKALFSTALATLLDPDVPALEKNMLLKKCIDRIEYKREKKKNNNRRYGDPEPMELDVHLRV